MTKISVDKPSGLAVNPVTNEIYVTSADNNTLTVIDGATDAVSRVMSVGLDPRAVAVNPATDKIYVACYGSGILSVVDEGSGSISTLSVRMNPLAVAVDQVANKIYVVGDGSSDVTVVDGATDTTSTIETSLTLLRDVAVNSASGRIYVNTGISVNVIDPKTDATTTITSGALPRGLAVDPNTGRVYVADGNNSVIEIYNDTSSSMISVGALPIDVAVNPATGQVYVADAGSDDLTVINEVDNHTTSISLDSQPVALAVNPATGKVYVLSHDGNSVSVIDEGAAAPSSGSGVNAPGSPSTPAPAQQTVISLDIGKTAYSVNGATKEMDAAPLLYEGRTLLPISYVATALGASVDWNPTEQDVTVSLNGKTLELWIGQSTARVNGAAVPIDPGNPDVVPTLAPPGRVMLPLRFIAENLGCQVDWNPSLQEIRLAYPEP